MLDSETLALREKERLYRLEQQIQDMLAGKSLDYRHIVRELDDIRKYSSPDKLAVVRILYRRCFFLFTGCFCHFSSSGKSNRFSPFSSG
jgi:hypothetical protein